MAMTRERDISDEAFRNWLDRADKIVEKRSGLSIFDLADICYRDMFEQGESPGYAARKAIRNELGYDD